VSFDNACYPIGANLDEKWITASLKWRTESVGADDRFSSDPHPSGGLLQTGPRGNKKEAQMSLQRRILMKTLFPGLRFKTPQQRHLELVVDRFGEVSNSIVTH
jgi:hypothetical protein